MKKILVLLIIVVVGVIVQVIVDALTGFDMVPSNSALYAHNAITFMLGAVVGRYIWSGLMKK